nr:CinA family protein [Ardenticatena sp.]
MYEHAAHVGHLLRLANATLATAESCTGGLLAHLITEVPGSSDYFLGGVVSYSNAAKMALLGVREATLAEHGAVSEPTAREMAEGVRARFQSTIGVGITGIAGPEGGTPEKPVGLVYIGVSTPTHTIVRRFVWQTGDRSANKLASALAALDSIAHEVREIMSNEWMPIRVEAEMAPGGLLRPLAFEVHGQRHVVGDVGRRQTDALGRQHIMVMTPPNRLWELVYDPQTQTWYLAKGPDRSALV